MAQIGVPSSVNTDLSLYFATETDLLAYTDNPPVGTVATANDTAVSFMWNGVNWRSLQGVTVYAASGTPAASAGHDGDISFDFANSAVYEKLAGVWTYEGTIGQLPGSQDPYTFSITSTTAIPGVGMCGFSYTGALSSADSFSPSGTNANGATYHLAQGKERNAYFRVAKATDSTAYITFRFIGTVGSKWVIDVIDFSSSNPFADGDLVIVTWARTSGLWRTGTTGLPSTLIGKNGDFSIDTVSGYLYQKVSGTWVVIQTASGIPYHGTFDVVSTSASTDIVSQLIVGGTLGANSGILITVEGDYLNNSGSSRGVTLSLKYGATTLWGDATGAAVFGTSPTHRAFFWQAFLKNENATNAQRVAGWASIGDSNAGSVAGLGNLTATPQVVAEFGGSAAIASTSDQTLALSFQHSANSASLECKGAYTIMVIP